jgi:hypothetical protein
MRTDGSRQLSLVDDDVVVVVVVVVVVEVDSSTLSSAYTVAGGGQWWAAGTDEGELVRRDGRLVDDGLEAGGGVEGGVVGKLTHEEPGRW